MSNISNVIRPIAAELFFVVQKQMHHDAAKTAKMCRGYRVLVLKLCLHYFSQIIALHLQSYEDYWRIMALNMNLLRNTAGCLMEFNCCFAVSGGWSTARQGTTSSGGIFNLSDNVVHTRQVCAPDANCYCA